MTITASSQALVGGQLTGSFGVSMGLGGVDGKYRSGVVLYKLDETLFDITTLMPSSGGTVGIAAGSAQIGSVLGKTSMVTVTPTVTSNGVYPVGALVGGLMTFAVGGAGTGGELKHIRVTSKTASLTTDMIPFVFSANPSSSTWTDRVVPAINTADIISLIGHFPMTIPTSLLGTMTLWTANNLGVQFSAANLYVALVTVAGFTMASTSAADITVELGMRVD